MSDDLTPAGERRRFLNHILGKSDAPTDSNGRPLRKRYRNIGTGWVPAGGYYPEGGARAAAARAAAEGLTRKLESEFDDTTNDRVAFELARKRGALITYESLSPAGRRVYVAVADLWAVVRLNKAGVPPQLNWARERGFQNEDLLVRERGRGLKVYLRKSAVSRAFSEGRLNHLLKRQRFTADRETLQRIAKLLTP